MQIYKEVEPFLGINPYRDPTSLSLSLQSNTVFYHISQSSSQVKRTRIRNAEATEVKPDQPRESLQKQTSTGGIFIISKYNWRFHRMKTKCRGCIALRDFSSELIQKS